MAVGIGVELGPAVLRAAVVERRGPSLKLLAWRELPYETGSPESLTQSLTHLRRTLRLKSGIVLGMSTGSVILATVEPLVVDPRRAALAVEFELQQYLPFGLEDAAWHYQWLNGTSMGGRGASRRSPLAPGRAAGPGGSAPTGRGGPKAVVAAMKRSRLEERLACCRRAGLSVRAVAINPLAMLNTWGQDVGSARPTSTLFLHLSEQSGEWVLWSPSQVQVFPIAIDASASSPAAQQGKDWPSLDALVQELLRSLEALRASAGALVSDETSVWLLGANPQLSEVQQRLASSVRMPVAPFKLSRTLRLDAVQGSVERAIIPVGLALQGLSATAPVQLNLLAEAQLIASGERTRLMALIAGGLFAAVAIGCGLSGMLDVRQRHVRVLALLDERERTHQTLRPEVRSLLKQQAKLERRITQLRSLVTDRAFLGHLLVGLAKAMPDDVWLTKLDASKSGRFEGLVEGRAKSFQSVTKFIDQLKGIRGVTGVKPLATNVTADETTGREIVIFSVVFEGSLEPTATEDTEEQSEPQR